MVPVVEIGGRHSSQKSTLYVEGNANFVVRNPGTNTAEVEAVQFDNKHEADRVREEIDLVMSRYSLAEVSLVVKPDTKGKVAQNNVIAGSGMQVSNVTSEIIA